MRGSCWSFRYSPSRGSVRSRQSRGSWRSSTGFSPVTRTSRRRYDRWRNDDRLTNRSRRKELRIAHPQQGRPTARVTPPGRFATRRLEPPSGHHHSTGPPPSVAIAASAPAVFFGGGLRLTGTISSGATNQDVSIWAQPFGQTSYAKVVDLKTATGGTYDWSTVPQVLTNYQARWGNRASAIVAVGALPLTIHARAVQRGLGAGRDALPPGPTPPITALAA